MSRKLYIIDTNVLINSPYSPYAFDEHDVAIVDTVLEELDVQKSLPGEKGYNAREVIRILEALRENGSLLEGVPLPGGGQFFVLPAVGRNPLMPENWDLAKPNHAIIATALAKAKGLGNEVVYTDRCAIDPYASFDNNSTGTPPQECGVKICKSSRTFYSTAGSAELQNPNPTAMSFKNHYTHQTQQYVQATPTMHDCARIAAKVDNYTDVILVTNDISMRLKADRVGLKAEEYRTEQSARLDQQYAGRCIVDVTAANIDLFYKEGSLGLHFAIRVNDEENTGDNAYTFTENEFVLLRDEYDHKHTAMARYDGKAFVPLRYAKEHPHGVKPKNLGQRFVQEALMAPVEEAPLVIIKGPAGTAKTFYSLAVGLEKVLNQEKYEEILVARPNVKFDEDIGYLKGSEKEKIDPLMRPVYDNLKQLTKTGSNSKDDVDTSSYAEVLFEQGKVVAQALAYMRGRSICDSYIIIDEAQNMTPLQTFGIISRAGMGSKVILVGDPQQIDNPHLDSRTNGLSYASEKMRGSPLCWQMTFTDSECVRSPLALEAIKRLTPKGLAK